MPEKISVTLSVQVVGGPKMADSPTPSTCKPMTRSK